MVQSDSTSEQNSKLIDLKKATSNPYGRLLISVIQSPVEKCLSLGSLNNYYAQFAGKVATCSNSRQIFQAALDTLRVTYTISPSDLEKIPENGSLIVVANHPFGGLEGVILGRILLEVRSDVKILGNYLLKQIAGIRDSIISVDPFAGADATRANIRGLKEVIQCVRSGGVLAAFPAGEVSSFHPAQRRVTDPEWAVNVGGLIRHTKSAVLPVYFPGKNSLLFQLVGLIHPRLRTALLPRELINKSNNNINVYVGKVIPWNKLQRLESDRALIDYLRLNTYFLKNRSEKKHHFPSIPLPKPAQSPQEEIISPVSIDLLCKDVASLSGDHLLVEKGDLQVFIARSDQIPNLLNEIGRLREVTFREVQEGTGNCVDLDHFDSYYLHLFLWNRKDRDLVGAYRIGPTDEILKHHGPKGLYTNQLFRFKPALLKKLTGALEMGRSFIRSEYQRKFNSLMLLWRGIGEYIARNPQYKLLFGPVSISQDYHSVSRNLIVRFLEVNKFDSALSRFVSPRNPYRVRKLKGIDQDLLLSRFQDIEDISLLISGLEKDGKGIPILLRQYLKLNGNLISFNVDKAFASVVDGLLLVDLTRTDPRLLKRFMGKNGYNAIMRYHSKFPRHEDSHEPRYKLTRK